MAESYKLTYFDFKALGEPARLIFAYTGVPYEDNRIEKEQWMEHKAKYPYGQLPVLQVGDKTLAQSNTICRYLAKKHNLVGENDWEASKMDEIADALNDLLTEFRKYYFWEQDETKKAEKRKNFLETVAPKYFGKFEEQVNSNEGSYMVGKNLSWIDIVMAHYLEFYDAGEPGIAKSYPGLNKLQQTVYNIPQIKAWIEKRPVTQW